MKTISYQLDEHVAILTINSPPANALSSALINDIDEKLNEIEANHSVKVIVLKGEGKFFSAGADIKEFTSLRENSDYQVLSERGQQVFNRIDHFPVPIIAAIHGAALGGGLELAMACHIRLVTANTKLGLPELTLGIIPGFAGTQRLPHYVGTAKAYEMILTGQPISGKEACSLGLANHVVEEDQLIPEAMKLAKGIAKKSKTTINHVMNLIPFSKPDQFTKGSQAEAEAFGHVFNTEDAAEGIQAFMEKRKPNFKDK
ncbi:enoyl-CoA hydratase [Virgibacillus alimentarius]|uniref:Enoyl-CoA hydratase n=1 Tax=Virgibacillus alimentarius TaxID=698769 RepID=A0ABS4S5A6_9BACI|nr:MULTISPECIES: enoyl-CoA hydratase [Virgibacillus]MBP2256682.1 enoyl-CoA hydratase [Virgibacillus alimentarius]HLR67144.1 enoyl-CoA hydratase [Virgibacillus sp.]